jgi:hypothetical protein
MNTTKTDPDVLKKRIEDLKKHHEATFKKIGYDVYYKPHMCYRPKGKDTQHISFWASELRGGKDIYTEFASREYISEDPTRTLYKWKYDPAWAEIYEPVLGKDGKSERYLIPVSELVVIPHVEASKEITLELDNPDIDMPIDQITIRDLAAVLLNKPVSQKKWLNDIITKTIRP